MAHIAQIAPIAGDFQTKHIVSIGQFSKEDILQVLEEAYLMQQLQAAHKGAGLLPNHVLVAMMAQDSSRTGGSFATAMDRLGGKGRIPDLGHSSMNKGEDFNDTALCLATQADVLVVRTAEDGGVEKAIQAIQVQQQLLWERDKEEWDVRIINAGDGTNEHPSQTLIDLFTMHKRFGGLEGLELTFVGALGAYRATNSLALAASLFGMKVNLVMPEFSPMQAKFVDKLNQAGCLGEVATDVRPFLKKSQVIYVARAAVEYAKNAAEEKQMRGFLAQNTITPALLKETGAETVIMHPLPRNSEIDKRVDPLAQNLYVAEMRNGIPVRMALLAKMFGVSAADALAIPAGLGETKLKVSKTV